MALAYLGNLACYFPDIFKLSQELVYKSFTAVKIQYLVVLSLSVTLTLV
jgi:hypothetical protein